MDKNNIEFSAIIAPIQTGITIGLDGARIKLDIPESESAAYHKLSAFGRGKILKVKIEIVEDQQDNGW
ncbi:hypothetical protein [Geotoga petraea]|jgi:hypothetical protein|uniref:Uncharacterized protein n=1 Tax=Geotoga petraea TaxID=28234 RepID=A0A1G6LTJ7_9BACT|nr:hypothetical protein [Geotoga petraea]SDC46075.1 hypothetical protein SAMN04488588_1128 [Geotoga petraea]